jgi:hypothetical protein
MVKYTGWASAPGAPRPRLNGETILAGKSCLNAAFHSVDGGADGMHAVADPADQDGVSSQLLVAFCEACERLIFIRSLLNDPRHRTRRQGTAVTRLLHAGLDGVERQLDTIRPLVFEPHNRGRERAPAGIGIAVAVLRQVHAQLGLLGTRWQLGTIDLFVRKLVAEGVAVLIPTLCPTDQFDAAAVEVGERFNASLVACGLVAPPLTGDSPVLTIPTMDLLDPLSWAAHLYPLAAAMVTRQGVASQLRGPSNIDPGTYGRLCTAGYAARLVGEATFAACAARTLLDRLCGVGGSVDIDLLGEASKRYQKPIAQSSRQTLTNFFFETLNGLSNMGAAWGSTRQPSAVAAGPSDWADVDSFLGTAIPEPVLPRSAEAEALYNLLADGRPINARPPDLPIDFAERLGNDGDAAAFYELLPAADERPCSLATILQVGWHYKVRRTYPLCATLMSTDGPWRHAIDALTGHVLERCGMLQQSIEAAYVQQVFTPLGVE